METQQKTKFSLEQVRSLYDYLLRNDEEDSFRDLLSSEILISDYELGKFIESVQDSNLTVKQFLDGDYFEDCGTYYNEEDYCITREGGVMLKDDCGFCNYYEEYCEEVFTVFIDRSNHFYCQDAIDSYSRKHERLYEHDGNYYNYNALERYDLVICEDTDEITHMDNAYYNESDGCWYSEPQDEYVRDYHEDTTVKKVTFSDSPKFFIGFEIEKEDSEVKESILIEDFEKECEGWRKEKDGSLCSVKGYELISPCYELNTEEILDNIKSNETIVKHINAKLCTDSCGGHINISEDGLTGADLFEKIQGYTPLIHALYYKRIDKRYSKGKSNKDIKDDNEKYQSVRIHRNRIEYRIISAVPNLDTLAWRTKLFEIILNNQTGSVEKAFLNCFTILKEHLQVMYPTNEAFDKLINRVVLYTENYEGIILKRKNQNENNENN